MSFISGAYSATWGGQPLGMVEGGFLLSYVKEGRDITGNRTGDAIIDSLYMGLDMRVSFVLSQVSLSSVQELLWTIRDAFGAGGAGEVGTSSFLMSKALTLTACNQTQNSNSIPKVITFFHTNVMNGHEVQLAFGNSHRKAQVVMRVYPRKTIQVPELGGGPSTNPVTRNVVYDYFEAT
jgi:hypothetical protein